MWDHTYMCQYRCKGILLNAKLCICKNVHHTCRNKQVLKVGLQYSKLDFLKKQNFYNMVILKLTDTSHSLKIANQNKIIIYIVRQILYHEFENTLLIRVLVKNKQRRKQTQLL